jgi:TolB-like protein/Tfp pilus assembly protein PilF
VSLFAELKRRKVIRVAVVYAATAFAVLQAADIMLPRMGVPDWGISLVIALTLLGFPIALVLGWALEVTPDGLKRTEAAPAETNDAAPPALLGKRTVFAAALLVVLGIGLGAGWFLRPAADSQVVSSPDASPAPADAENAALTPVSLTPASKSIAVLPFANMSADPEQEFFADGITEDILTRLAAIGELRVISRTSIMRYKNSDKSLPEIAAELGVSHVLEGSVRRAGNQVRITGQLIRAADDAHLWAESFDRDLADIFAVQTEIAGHIVQALQLQLTEGERERLQHQGTDNAAAYEQYLLGRAQLNQSYSNPGEILALINNAEARFRAALEQDPDYADAWAGLAQTSLWRLGSRYEPEQAEANYQAVLDAARRAIRLAPESAAGYVWLGQAYLDRGLGEAASEQFQLAAEVEPDSIDVLTAQAGIHRSEGRLADAVRLLERAVRIEPGDANLQDSLGRTAERIGELRRAREAYEVAWGDITPHEARLLCMLVDVSVRAGEIETARTQVARYRELEPDSPFLATCSLGFFLQMRDLDAAREVFEQQREYFEQRLPLWAALTLARTQPDAELEPLLKRAERRLREELPRAWGSGLEIQLGKIELLRGNHAVALAHLEAAVALGWRVYRELELDITWDPIREDPKFQALARQVDEDLARQRTELAGGARQP